MSKARTQVSPYLPAVSSEPDRVSHAAELVHRGKPLVIAHRGASADAPENTLPAFRLALRHRPDLVELDYHHCAEGVPVVFHDKYLDRTTDAAAKFGEKTPIAQKSLRELRTLDAGAWFHARFRGTRIPTLAEALDAIQVGSTTLIEHKSGDANTLIALLQQKQLIDSVVVQSFDWQFLADCHQQAPRLVLGALGDKQLTAEHLPRIRHTGAQVVGWNSAALSAIDLDTLHEGGWKVWLYTVNDPDEAGKWLDRGIDGLITNEPARIGGLRREV